MSSRSRILILALLCAVLVVAYLVREAVLPPAVSVARPTRGPAIQAVYATGVVEPTVMVPVSGRATARITKLFVDEGATVSKGELLAQLEDTDLTSTVAELAARAMLADADLNRITELAKRGLVSRQELERSTTERNAAAAAVARAEAQAEYMKLRAPEAGSIIRRDGEVGELLPANQPLFWLTCCAPLRVSAEVDEEDIPLVQPGQRAVLSVDALPGRVFHATVQTITPKGDPIARSYRVRLSIDAAEELLIGMTTEVNITVRESSDAILVPSGSVIQNDLLIVRDSKVVRQPARVGARGPQVTEIIEGVSEDDLVILSPDDAPSEGTTVRTNLVE